ncbi:MAG: hypothetical protein GC137_09530 [Alphaproteobacteria bacterium]|nr:hypothetical protein [Alphaproteobacteria bacterium]
MSTEDKSSSFAFGNGGNEGKLDKGLTSETRVIFDKTAKGKAAEAAQTAAAQPAAAKPAAAAVKGTVNPPGLWGGRGMDDTNYEL